MKKLNELSEKVDFGYGCPWPMTAYFIQVCGQCSGRWLRTAPDILLQKEIASLDVLPSHPKFPSGTHNGKHLHLEMGTLLFRL